MQSFNVWLEIAVALLYIIIISACVYVVLSENRNPIRALAWTVALLFLPGIGLVFYLFFGRSLKGIRLISRRNKRRLMRGQLTRRKDSKNFDNINPAYLQLVKLTHKLCRTPFTQFNEIETFTVGKEKFDSLEQDILKAKSSIFIQYYIFSDDALGKRFSDLLIKKAQEGVAVKVLYDHFGSFKARSKFFRQMERAGVEVHPFFRVTFPQFANRINWRNHRKIVIIDNNIAYIGGMNIADRYVNGLPGKRLWRDTHFRLKGEIIEQLYYSFMIDWNFKSSSTSFPPFVPPAHNNISENAPYCGMQLITSGPTDAQSTIALIFLKAISSAKKRIYIQTPYFLPTQSLLDALKSAALSKVDVRIMIPEHSDSRILTLSSFSYVTQCLDVGIRVFLYKPGMLHAKTLIIDDNLASVGSTNFDFRSFENNFECNALVFSPDFNKQMREIFFNDLNHCIKLSQRTWRSRPLIQRAGESIVRLFAPIL